MPTALVTGVAGFIGSHLAFGLLDRGYTVRGVDTFETGKQRNLADLRDCEGFSFAEVDIRDADAMAEMVSGVDSVFHEAAVVSVPESVEDPVTTTEVNCTGTATVLDAARRADVDDVVLASSSAIYGSSEPLPKVETMEPSPESPYASSKLYGEQLAAQYSDHYDVDTVALRYFNVFGPRQDPSGDYAAVIPKFIDLLLDGERPVIFGDGEQSRDFVFVDDVVRANILAADSDVSGEVINVARGERTTVNELVAVLNDILGTELKPEYDDPRPGDVRHSGADISKARELLGFEPQTGFEEGLRRTVEWYESA